MNVLDTGHNFLCSLLFGDQKNDAVTKMSARRTHPYIFPRVQLVCLSVWVCDICVVHDLNCTGQRQRPEDPFSHDAHHM